MSVENKRTVWLHVHVPKCGGSTFRGSLQHNFKEAYYSCSTLMDQRIYSKKDIGIILKRNPWLSCYSDHKLSLDLPYESDDFHLETLTFVRDPLSHFLSHYFWAKNNVKAEHVARGKSLDEYLDKKFNHTKGRKFMSQIRHLNPPGTENPSIDFVKETIRAHGGCIFPIEQYDQACIYLEKRWPEQFRDLSYVRANVSKRDSDVSEEQVARIKEVIAPEYELIHFAEQHFAQKFEELFNPEEAETALSQFEARCAKKSGAAHTGVRKLGKRFVRYIENKYI